MRSICHVRCARAQAFGLDDGCGPNVGQDPAYNFGDARRDTVSDGLTGNIPPVSAGPPPTNAILELSAVIEQWRNAIDELSERT